MFERGDPITAGNTGSYDRLLCLELYGNDRSGTP